MKYNTDKHFWEKKRPNCNCGSFAFDLDSWYTPGSLSGDKDDDDEDTIYDFIEDLYECGHNEDSIANKLLQRYAHKVAEDFGDSVYGFTLKEIDPYKLDDDEELIALRAGVSIQDDRYLDLDYDFHFKVFRDNRWYEKQGATEVHVCLLDVWCGSMEYNSVTAYFIHRRPENLTDVEKFDIL